MADIRDLNLGGYSEKSSLSNLHDSNIDDKPTMAYNNYVQNKDRLTDLERNSEMNWSQSSIKYSKEW